MKEIEIEKRYIVRINDVGVLPIKPIEVYDIYLPHTEKNPQLRLRKVGTNTVITRKYPIDPKDLSTMIEETINLSSLEFDYLLSCVNTSLSSKKLRITLKTQNYTLDLNIYKDKLEGLNILDVEGSGELETSKIEEFFQGAITVIKEVTNVKECSGKA